MVKELYHNTNSNYMYRMPDTNQGMAATVVLDEIAGWNK